MTEIVNDIPDIFNLPSTSHERIITPGDRACPALRERGILGIGLSNLTPGYEVGRNQRHYLVLLASLKGEGRLRLTRSEHRLTRGTVCLLPKHHPHHYLAEQPWDMLFLHLNRDQQWMNFPDTPTVRMGLPVWRLRSAFEGLWSQLETRDAFADAAIPLAASIFLLEVERLLKMPPGGAPREERLIQSLWETVGASLEEPWPLRRLAQAAHVSPATLARITRRVEKTTPVEAVAQLRMRQACRLLVTTDAPVYQVAEQVGYGNPYAFSRAFKRIIGLSPHQWRGHAIDRAGHD